VNSFISSIEPFANVTDCKLSVFTDIIMVLSWLTCSPTDIATSSRDLVFACIWFKECDSSARSSAYFQRSSESLFLCLVIQLTTRRNRKGDNTRRPCLVPALTSNASVSPPPWISLHLELLYWNMMTLISFYGMSCCLIIFCKVSLLTLSNAFSKSM